MSPSNNSTIVCLLTWATLLFIAGQAQTLTLDMDLSKETQVQQTVSQFQGRLVGGQFTAEGWKTTKRTDYIQIPLPPGIDTRHGSFTLWVKGFEARESHHPRTTCI